ncbi:unnamed protein product [Phytomonas sp. EM1]|nr:unnamed protein product [Phytomonas sp. EM1]|eukprot:CCW65849.1 unnamed protein product [Phytomonas sp. isolate EM1]
MRKVRLVLQEHNASELREGFQSQEYSLPLKNSDTLRSDCILRTYDDMVVGVTEKVSALVKEKMRYSLSCMRLKSVIQGDSASMMDASSDAEPVLELSPRSQNDSSSLTLNLPGFTSRVKTMDIESTSDNSFHSSIKSYVEPIVQEVRNHIQKRSEEMLQMRKAVITSFEALGGTEDIRSVDAIKASNYLVDIAVDTGSCITEMKLILDPTGEHSGKVRLSSILGNIKTKLGDIEEANKDAGSILYALAGPDTSINEMSLLNSPDGRRLEKKKKPPRPEFVRENPLYIARAIYEKELIIRGSDKGGFLHLSSYEFNHQNVKAFREAIAEKKQQFQQMSHGITVALSLLGDTMDPSKEDINTLTLRLIQIAKDVHDAMMLSQGAMSEENIRMGNIKAISSCGASARGNSSRESNIREKEENKCSDDENSTSGLDEMPLFAKQTANLVQALQSMHIKYEAVEQEKECMFKQLQFLLDNDNTEILEEHLERARAYIASLDAKQHTLFEELTKSKERLQENQQLIESLCEGQCTLQNELKHSQQNLMFMEENCERLTVMLSESMAFDMVFGDQAKRLEELRIARVRSDSLHATQALKSQCTLLLTLLVKNSAEQVDGREVSAEEEDIPLSLIQRCSEYVSSSIELLGAEQTLHRDTKDKLQDTQRRLAHAMVEEAHLRELLGGLRQQLEAEKDNAIQQMRDQIQEQQRGAEKRLEYALSVADKAQKDLNERIESLKDRLSDEEQLHKIAEAKTIDLLGQLNAKSEEVGELQVRLEAAEKRRQEAESCLAVLERTHAMMQASATERDAFYEHRHTELLQKLVVMEQEIASVRIALKAACTERSAADALRSQAETKLAKLTDIVERVKNRLLHCVVLPDVSQADTLMEVVDVFLEEFVKVNAKVSRKGTSRYSVGTTTESNVVDMANGFSTVLKVFQELALLPLEGVMMPEDQANAITEYINWSVEYMHELDSGKALLINSLQLHSLGNSTSQLSTPLVVLVQSVLDQKDEAVQQYITLREHYNAVCNEIDQLREMVKLNNDQQGRDVEDLVYSIRRMREIVQQKRDADEVVEKHTSEMQLLIDTRFSRLIRYAAEQENAVQHIQQLHHFMRHKLSEQSRSSSID